MNDQLKNIIAQILTGVGGYFVGRGWIDNATLVNVIIPGVLGLFGVGYSIYLNLRSVKVAAVATPGTTVVLPSSEQALANTLPSNVKTTAEASVVSK